MELNQQILFLGARNQLLSIVSKEVERCWGMHVEIRLHSVSQACVFDAQSFYRVKQLLSSRLELRGHGTDRGKRELHGEPLVQIRSRTPYVPILKLQIVFERFIELESSSFSVHMDSRQHESRTRSNWNNSAVGTAYHSTNISELILASLPLEAADGVVKIRLLQLPPPIDYDTLQVVKREVRSSDDCECRYDTPLCIGVAKISLSELMTANRTVNIALQAKRSVLGTVEAHNLDTVATNAMLGKGEKDGSALLSIQANGYIFGKIPGINTLLPQDDTERLAKTSAKDTDARSVTQRSMSTDAVYEYSTSIEMEVFNSTAIRFVLVPYVALADLLLLYSDIFSWRVMRKSTMALIMVIVALFSDLLDGLLILDMVLNVVLFMRSISKLQAIPIRDTSSSTPVSLQSHHRSSKDLFQPYMYSSENLLLNSLLRARIFFSCGLQEDTYLELALSAHFLRHHRRAIVYTTFILCTGFLVLSIDTLVILLTLATFLLYPFYLNATKRRRHHRRSSRKTPSFSFSWSRLLQNPQRLLVVRVVRVSVSRLKSNLRQSKEGSLAASTTETLKYELSRFNPNSIFPTESPSEKSEASQKSRGNSSGHIHRRARTMDFDLFRTYKNQALPFENLQRSHTLRYFVVLCFSFNGNELSGLANTVGSLRKSGPNAALQRRLCEQLKLARDLPVRLGADSMPANGISSSTPTPAFSSQGASSCFDGYTGSALRERSEAFHTFFINTLSLLVYLRQHWTLHLYVTQSGVTKCIPDSLRRIEVLAQPQWLVAAGDDDGVTKLLLGKRQSMQSLPPVGKFCANTPIECSGRVMALLAGYLLQGACLSVYSSANGCATIMPLLSPGDTLERFPQPNPCPRDLLNTLEAIWRGKADGSSEKGEEVYFTVDAVLQIITMYKDFWDGTGVGPSQRSVGPLDSAVVGEPNTSGGLRHSRRSVFPSLLSVSRVSSFPLAAAPSSTPLSRQTSLVHPSNGGGVGLQLAEVPRTESTTPQATMTRHGSASATPLHLPAASMPGAGFMNTVSDTTPTSSAEKKHNDFDVAEPVSLYKTWSGGVRLRSRSSDTDTNSPERRLSNTKELPRNFDAKEPVAKSRK